MKNKIILTGLIAIGLFVAIAGCTNSATSPTTYTVTYDGNASTGGSVPVDSSDYESGTTVTVLGNTGSLVKTGSTFAGWNTAADGTGTAHAVSSSFDMGTANVILYARWTSNDATLFDAALIPDSKLKAAIAAAVGKSFGTQAGCITVEDIKVLTYFDWSSFPGVSDLTGLENLVSLQNINLEDNPIPVSQYAMITPANFPKLVQLDIWHASGSTSTFADALAVFARFSNLNLIRLEAFTNVSQSDFDTLYSSILYPDRANLIHFRFNYDTSSSSITTVAAAGNLTNLRFLGMDHVPQGNLNFLVTLTNLGCFESGDILDFTPLKTLYDAGGFHAANTTGGDWGIFIGNIGHNPALSTANQAIFDYLTGRSVAFYY